MGRHYVLDLKLTQLDLLIANLSKLLGICLGSQATVILRLGSGADHLARSEDQRCRLGVSYPHNSRCKSLWLILDIPSIHTNLIQVQRSSQVSGRYYILQLGEVRLRNQWLLYILDYGRLSPVRPLTGWH